MRANDILMDRIRVEAAGISFPMARSDVPKLLQRLAEPFRFSLSSSGAAGADEEEAAADDEEAVILRRRARRQGNEL